ncbi:MAG: VOC family protein [Armatimonadetes bacterium]|nr:VOC family protein [Armatimonadota bacterium]
MNRIVHFEIPADDPEKVAAFYTDVFGWTFTKWEGPMEYWMVTTGDASQPGIDGGLMRREHPGQPVTNVVDVASVDECLAKIAASGGEVVVPKMPVPGVGWVAYFKDPDGNISGMMEEDEAAA